MNDQPIHLNKTINPDTIDSMEAAILIVNGPNGVYSDTLQQAIEKSEGGGEDPQKITHDISLVIDFFRNIRIERPVFDVTSTDGVRSVAHPKFRARMKLHFMVGDTDLGIFPISHIFSWGRINLWDLDQIGVLKFENKNDYVSECVSAHNFLGVESVEFFCRENIDRLIESVKQFNEELESKKEKIVADFVEKRMPSILKNAKKKFDNNLTKHPIKGLTAHDIETLVELNERLGLARLEELIKLITRNPDFMYLKKTDIDEILAVQVIKEVIDS